MDILWLALPRSAIRVQTTLNIGEEPVSRTPTSPATLLRKLVE
jgi:hypothetical protein